MSRRNFTLQKRASPDGGILDIPHLAFFRYASIQDMINEFENTWGKKPIAICLPVVSPDGLNLDVEGAGLNKSDYSNAAEMGSDFGEIIEKISSHDLDIYLLLDPTLNFCNTDALHISDVIGDSSSALCIANPRSQELLGAILGTAVDEALLATKNGKGKLKGVVLDTVDLWPMGASSERITLTCFCQSCEKYISLRDPDLVEKFKTFPSPANLLLKDSGTGISHIHDIDISASDDSIIGLSRQKGFDKIYSDVSDVNLRIQSSVLIKYLKIRHEQTLDSIEAIFDEALNDLDIEIQRIILCEGSSYDWTSGLFLAALDKSPSTVCNEVWFDPKQSDLFLHEKPFRSYMWRRSRYYIDAFLNFAGNVSNKEKRATTGVGRLSKHMAKEMLHRRFAQALGASVREKSALASLPPMNSQNGESSRVGFVGVGLSNIVGNKFIDGIDIPRGLNEESDTHSRESLLKEFKAALKENN